MTDNPRLIVVLDFSSSHQVFSLVDQLDPLQCALKIGKELFTSQGPAIVKAMMQRGFRVFLDLKFYDIPNTVAKACQVAADMGVWMLSLHAQGGENMLRAAKEAVVSYEENKPLLIAVTVLTSFSHEQWRELGWQGDLPSAILHFAKLAQQVGLPGIVCSAVDVPLLRQALGDELLFVTPGIRCSTDDKQDQQRVATPRDAIQAGSDYLVIGRSITTSTQPEKVVQQILLDMNYSIQ